jgi:hypothetical protein
MHDACYWCQGDRRNSIFLLAFCLHVRDGEFCLWRLATATSTDRTSSSDIIDQAARQHHQERRWPAQASIGKPSRRWWLGSTARRRNTSTVTTYPCRILSRAEHAWHGVDLRLQDTAGWPERLYSTRSRPWAPMTSRHLWWGHDGVCSHGLPGNWKEAKREHHGLENLREVEIDRARCVAHVHRRLFWSRGCKPTTEKRRRGRLHCSGGEVPGDGAPSHGGTGADVWVTRSYTGPRRRRWLYEAKQEVIGGGVDRWTWAAALWRELGHRIGLEINKTRYVVPGFIMAKIHVLTCESWVDVVVESILNTAVVVVRWHLIRRQKGKRWPGKVCLSNAQNDPERTAGDPRHILEID